MAGGQAYLSEKLKTVTVPYTYFQFLACYKKAIEKIIDTDAIENGVSINKYGVYLIFYPFLYRNILE